MSSAKVLRLDTATPGHQNEFKVPESVIEQPVPLTVRCGVHSGNIVYENGHVLAKYPKRYFTLRLATASSTRLGVIDYLKRGRTHMCFELHDCKNGCENGHQVVSRYIVDYDACLRYPGTIERYDTNDSDKPWPTPFLVFDANSRLVRKRLITAEEHF